MSESEVLQQLIHEQERRLHLLEGLTAELSLHNPDNDLFAVGRVTEVLAAWGTVNQGVFDEQLEALLKHFQDSYGIHPADGVVRADTWAALRAEVQRHLTELQNSLAAANHANHNHGTFRYDGGGHHDGGGQHANPAMVNQYLHTAGALLHACAGHDNPLLATNLHNDSRWVQVVIDCFGLFDALQALDHGGGHSWGSFAAGHYDDNLADAVRRYQHLNSIQGTGQVDGATWQRLADDLNQAVQNLQHRAAR